LGGKMKPYYQDKYATIYHGDCREILPQLPKCDLVLTDPLYGIGEAHGKNLSRGKWANPKDYGVECWDDVTVDFTLLELAISKSTNQIIWGGNYYPLPPTSCWLVWDKENGNNDFADCELAWTSFKSAVRIFRFRWAGMLQGDMKNKDYRYHPTQKPTALFNWVMGRYSKTTDLILDPFLGSGTTAFCAKKLNRRCIGIEIEEKYCEIAAKRLSQSVMELKI